MMDDTATVARAWPRVKWTRASQLAALMDDPASLKDVGALSPSAAFAQLRDDDPATATRLMAQCLPRIDAVQWLNACLAQAEPNPPPARAAAVKAVRRWLANPSDEARRLAYQAGDGAGWDTAEGLACLAIFMSGGSMAPPTQEIPVNPQPGVFGKVVAGAVLAAAQASGGIAFPARIAALLDIADKIAAGERTA